jgi:hypothetical protein
MARPTRKQLIAEIERLEPGITKAFSDAFLSVRTNAQLQRIAGLIAAGDLDEVAEELGLSSASTYSGLSEQIRSVFAAGGRHGVQELPEVVFKAGRGKVRLRTSFDMTNPRAEAWLRTHSSQLVTELVADQRNVVRIIVAEGTALGQNPRNTALDLIGRIGTSGRRTGGAVGLTSQQAQFVSNARAQLLSGDPAQMASYFERARRDKRFDGLVRKAIKEGRALSPADVEKVIGRYADRMLQLRGENIARTEALTAFNQAREEAFRQAVQGGNLLPDNVRKVWSATLDNRTRESHAALDGTEVGLEEPFTSPTGAQMLHPGDTSMGAGAEDVVNCRCMATYRVDQIAEAMRER